ncbi:MAG: hypothetical protein KDI07_10440 [Anaerolineae bacterium]|nr:hypothetical protein [Anaerolineae bacterium]MCB9130291.1 hypothetical protein [Anaerolineales bacterium]MCB0234492.1 hypothetical protein [Anaerolineae bacterium]MCB0242228.1 hypothetical protein [Anaerolineae bacterium]MCB0248985.1 hypothetical protein [Anaerolineae bacterium]
MKRPIGVTIIAVFVALAGLLAALVALQWLGLFPWMGPGPDVRTFNLWYALMYGLLAYIYIWVFQMLWTLNESGWIFVAVITIFDLILGLITMVGGGFVPTVVTAKFVLDALILIYIMLPGTRRAFGRP